MKYVLAFATLLLLSACSMEEDPLEATASDLDVQNRTALFNETSYSSDLSSDNLAGTWLALGNLRESVGYPYNLSHSIQHQRLFSIELSADAAQYRFYELDGLMADDYSEQALLINEAVSFSVFDSYFEAAGYTAFIHNNDSITLRANQSRYSGELQLIKISESPYRQIVGGNSRHVGTIRISYQRLSDSGDLTEQGDIETDLLQVVHTQHRIEWTDEHFAAFVDHYQKLEFFVAADVFVEALYGEKFLQQLSPAVQLQLAQSVQSLGLLNYATKNSLASEESQIDYAGVYNTFTEKVIVDQQGGDISFSFMFRNPTPDLPGLLSDAQISAASRGTTTYSILSVDARYLF